MFRAVRALLLPALLVCAFAQPGFAQDPPDPAKTPAMMKDVADLKTEAAKGATDATTAAHKYSDITWMLVSTALVMLMMPGLALFYGGMARRKNVLGTMMHTMVALGLVGVQWVVIGYALAFGNPLVKAPFWAIEVDKKDDKGEVVKDEKGEALKVEKKLSLVGFSPELVMLPARSATGMTVDEVLQSKGINPEKATDEQKKDAETESSKLGMYMTFPNTNLPLYLHAMFQGMFAIITVALVSGAFAERVKFGSYLLFSLLWTTIVYDPLAHMVWSFQWDDKSAGGLFGGNGAIDFAGGTVVHIAAGFSGLAAVLFLRKRIGYGKQTFHPNSMVLTLLGAGLLWFGWFGFNGGSALYSNGQAISAFTVTQVAAAMAGLSWLLVEWLHRGKPTALGFASGLVAGLVAITPASGYVAPAGALAIGAIAGVVCYWAVACKNILGYDDSLDAFGIHGVGGFLGAILTGVFVSLPLWVYGSELSASVFPGKFTTDAVTNAISFDMGKQLEWQLKASVFSAVYAFVVTTILVLLIDFTIGFTVTPKDEAMGLDLSQHGETGFDFGPDLDASIAGNLPKAAAMPGGAGQRFTVAVEGPSPQQLTAVWSKLCQTSDTPPSKEFKAVYPYITTVSGNRFRFRGGDPTVLKEHLKKLFETALGGAAIKTTVEK